MMAVEQSKQRLKKILDELSSPDVVTKKSKRKVIARNISVKPQVICTGVFGDKYNKHLTKTVIIEAILNGYEDYYILKPRLLNLFSRETRTLKNGKTDKRKFEKSLDQLLKAEGLKEKRSYGWWEDPNREQVISKFTEIDFFRQETLECSAFDKGMNYEAEVLSIFTQNGIPAQLTKSGSDFGADLTFSFLTKTFVVQCKNLNKKAGVKSIQEVLPAIKYYDADAGVVFSAQGFTKAATELSEKNNVVLVTGKNIKQMVRQITLL